MFGGVDWCAWVGGMKQLTLATVGFERCHDDAAGSVSGRDGAGCAVVGAVRGLIERSIRSQAMATRRSGSSGCCASLLQHWFNLSDPAVEEALYHSQAMRRFVAIDLGREPVPDETTVCRFRHLLERTIWAGGCSTRYNGTWR